MISTSDCSRSLLQGFVHAHFYFLATFATVLETILGYQFYNGTNYYYHCVKNVLSTEQTVNVMQSSMGET